MKLRTISLNVGSGAGKLVEVLPVFALPLGLLSAENGLAYMPANSIESRAYKNTFARKIMSRRLNNVQ
jgi:hypothetical protein